jgi:hypothetical protein
MHSGHRIIFFKMSSSSRSSSSMVSIPQPMGDYALMIHRMKLGGRTCVTACDDCSFKGHHYAPARRVAMWAAALDLALWAQVGHHTQVT